MLRSEKEEQKELQKQKLEDDKKAEYYLKSLEKFHDRSKDKKENATKQFDAIIVAISTAGIAFVTTYLKGFQHDLLLARLSQLGFVISLFSNLFSHIFSMFANQRAEQIACDDLNAARYGNYPKSITADTFEAFQEKREKKKEKFDLIVKILNITSFIILIVAVTLFMIFAINYPPELINPS